MSASAGGVRPGRVVGAPEQFAARKDRLGEPAFAVGRDGDAECGAGGGEGVFGADGQADVPGEVVVAEDAGAAGDPRDRAAAGVVAPVAEAGAAVVGGGDDQRRRLESRVADRVEYRA